MVMPMRNKAISKNTTQQTMLIFKKPLIIQFSRPGKGSAINHSKDKAVYHDNKQKITFAENMIALSKAITTP